VSYIRLPRNLVSQCSLHSQALDWITSEWHTAILNYHLLALRHDGSRCFPFPKLIRSEDLKSLLLLKSSLTPPHVISRWPSALKTFLSCISLQLWATTVLEPLIQQPASTILNIITCPFFISPLFHNLIQAIFIFKFFWFHHSLLSANSHDIFKLLQTCRVSFWGTNLTSKEKPYAILTRYRHKFYSDRFTCQEKVCLHPWAGGNIRVHQTSKRILPFLRIILPSRGYVWLWMHLTVLAGRSVPQRRYPLFLAIPLHKAIHGGKTNNIRSTP